jgi:hypothetical protein
MSERRFSDDEVAEIFRLAAESTEKNQPLLPPAQGMTLAQIQEIGREVGIAPDHLAAATMALDLASRPTTRRFLGLPVGVGLVADLHRNLSDAEWDQLVVDLRETFDARGQQKRDGVFRQWTNGNLQALLEPTPTGSRIRFRTVHGNARMMMAAGLSMLGFSVFFAVMAMTRMNLSGVDALMSVFTPAAVGAGMFAFGALRLPGWARTRLSQMQQVATRLALPPKPALPGGSFQRDEAPFNRA